MNPISIFTILVGLGLIFMVFFLVQFVREARKTDKTHSMRKTTRKRNPMFFWLLGLVIFPGGVVHAQETAFVSNAARLGEAQSTGATPIVDEVELDITRLYPKKGASKQTSISAARWICKPSSSALVFSLRAGAIPERGETSKALRRKPCGLPHRGPRIECWTIARTEQAQTKRNCATQG
ncbi:MAG: hypothetical protein WA857_03790 [Candidatus Acidiferrum sp.]